MNFNCKQYWLRQRNLQIKVVFSLSCKWKQDICYKPLLNFHVCPSFQQASPCPAPCSIPWVGLVPAPPSTPAEAPLRRPKEARPPRAPTNSWATATNTAATEQSGKARALVVPGLGDALITHMNVPSRSHTHAHTHSLGTVSTSLHMSWFCFQLSVCPDQWIKSALSIFVLLAECFQVLFERTELFLSIKGNSFDLLTSCDVTNKDMKQHKQRKGLWNP